MWAATGRRCADDQRLRSWRLANRLLAPSTPARFPRVQTVGMPTSLGAAAAGDSARPLALPNLAGGGFRLEDERGRPVILTFLRHAG